MSCDCTEFECIDVFMVECAQSVTLPLVATETGTWKMVYDFNGTPVRTDVAVVINQAITVSASVFNENYVHVVRFYKSDNTIFNDTCYKLNIMATVFTNPQSITANSLNGKAYAGNNTATQIFAELEGKELLTIAMELQELTPNMFTQTNQSVTINLSGVVFQGTVVLTWK